MTRRLPSFFLILAFLLQALAPAQVAVAIPPITYTLSGVVSLTGGGGLNGVTISYSGPASSSVQTANVLGVDGVYSISGLPAGSYTLTPGLAGYAFTPPQTTLNLSANQGNVNFSAAPVYVLGGSVTLNGAGLVGVDIAYSGPTSGTATTLEGGGYLISGLPAGSYTLTPSLAGYGFTPPQATVSLSADELAINFSAAPVFSIGGSVTLSGGGGLPGVNVAYSGPSSGSVTTIAGGAYTIPGLVAGAYLLTPSLAGYQFTADQTVNVPPNQTGTNFTATPVFSIDGRVTVGGVTSLPGVNIHYSGPESGDVQTVGGGFYTLANLPAGSYTLTPSLAEYTFSPANQIVSLSANQSGINFSATRTLYDISGTVREGAAGLPNVVISYTGARFGSATTDPDGRYTIPGLISGSYHLTAYLAEYTFSAALDVTLGPSQPAADFSATRLVYNLSGNVTVNGVGLPEVTINYTNNAAVSGSVQTGPTGVYTISNLINGSYSLTPSLAEYSFSPTQTVKLLGPSQSNINFTGERITYTIGGKVTLNGQPQDSVRIDYSDSGPMSDFEYTGSLGTYSIPGLTNGSYTVTPSKAGFRYTPAQQTVSLGGSKLSVNFSATPVFTISGKVSLNGQGLPQVVISYSGPENGSATTGVDGTYSLPGLLAGSYQLSAALAEYTFSSVPNVSVGPNQPNINFSATRKVYTLSGSITLDGAGLPLVAVAYTGPGGTGSVNTGAGGAYSIPNLISGSYTLTPSLADVTFMPDQRVVALSPDQSGIDFSATRNPHTIQGAIRNGPGGVGVKGVTLEALQGGSVKATSITGNNGSYTLTGLVSGTYTVRPRLSGARFRVGPTDPRQQLDVTVAPDQTGVDFLIEFPRYLPGLYNKYDPMLQYAANFGSATGWEPLYLGSGGSAGVLGGAYFLAQTTPYQFSASLAPFAPASLYDHGYELTVKLSRVGSGDPSFGIVFDWKAGNDFFLFQIDTDSQIYYIDHKGVVLANYLPSSQIKTGSQENELRVVRRQSAVDFYINGSLVLQNAAAPDLAAPGEKGRLGVQLSTYATPAEIHYSSFVVRRLP